MSFINTQVWSLIASITEEGDIPVNYEGEWLHTYKRTGITRALLDLWISTNLLEGVNGTTSVPPAVTAEGDSWIIGAAAGAPWDTVAQGTIATWAGGKWRYIAPEPGTTEVIDKSTGTRLRWDGAIWGGSPTGGGAVSAAALPMTPFTDVAGPSTQEALEQVMAFTKAMHPIAQNLIVSPSDPPPNGLGETGSYAWHAPSGKIFGPQAADGSHPVTPYFAPIADPLMTGATATTVGVSGDVPAGAIGSQDAFLNAAGNFTGPIRDWFAGRDYSAETVVRAPGGAGIFRRDAAGTSAGTWPLDQASWTSLTPPGVQQWTANEPTSVGSYVESPDSTGVWRWLGPETAFAANWLADLTARRLAPVALGTVRPPILHSMAGLRAPAVTDDAASGYGEGSLWWDGTTLHQCMDATVGAAQWVALTGQHARNQVAEPAAGDDDADGYAAGATWHMADGRVFQCLDATTGAAVWVDRQQTLSAMPATPLAPGLSGSLPPAGIPDTGRIYVTGQGWVDRLDIEQAVPLFTDADALPTAAPPVLYRSFDHNTIPNGLWYWIGNSYEQS